METGVEPGSTLAGYRLELPLGRGGMGAVYLADDLALGRRVALKLLAPELVADERFRERFLSESRLAASLDHPAIVPVYAAGESDGSLYIAMRYVEGTDLRKLLAQGALERVRSVRILSSVASALDAAHRRGLVHRDVKPANVLLDREDNAYLSDFGLTKEASSQSGWTQTGQLVGTLDYIAPEQIEGKPVDGRADVYALGCLLYECLTGKKPFARESEVATLWAHVHEPPPATGERELDAVIAKALAKNPRDRYATAGELMAAARQALGIRTGELARPRFARRIDRRLLTVAAAVLLAGVAALLVALLTGGSGHGSTTLAENSVGLIDPNSGRFTASAPARERPAAIAAGSGPLWLAADDGTVSRVDLDHPGSVEKFAVGGSPVALTATRGSVWVVDQDSRAVKVLDPDAGRVVGTVHVGNGPSAIAAGAGALWVTNTTDGTLTRIDPVRVRAVRRIAVGGEPNGVAVGPDAVWVTSAGTDTVVRVDPRTNEPVTSIPVGSGPGPVAVSADGVWVANTLDGTVSRIDPRLNRVAATIPVGSTADALAANEGDVWAGSASADTLARIDPHTNSVARRLDIGSPPSDLAAAGRGIAVATMAAPAKGRGGTLRMLGYQEGFRGPGKTTFDPAKWFLEIGWSILATTNDGLVTYRRASGAAGYQIVSDLARALPLVGSGGRRYTFQLRRGLRYSTGRLVRPGDVRASIERLWKIGSPALYLPPLKLLGESACNKHPRRCDLSQAIVTNDGSDTITFRLASPNPLFLRLLAMPFYDVLPAGTPARDAGRPLPATGAYRIARVVRNRKRQVVRVELVRNEQFHEWSRAAQPEGFADRVVWRVERDPARAVRDVLAGRADYHVANGSVPSRLGALERHHASQLHSEPLPWLLYVFLNTRIAPFNSLDARRALNFAVDREKVARLFGGPLAARPTCQVLPPGYPGYRPTCPYTLTPNAGGTWRAPNLAKARALAGRSGTLSTPVTVRADTRPLLRAIGRYVTQVLHALGYRARLVTLPPKGEDSYTADSRNRVQLAVGGWSADVPGAAEDFFPVLLSCAAFRPGSPENLNQSGFCARKLDALMRRAASREPTDQVAAGRLWAAVDRRVVAEAPWVPLVTLRWVDVVSKRLRNYSFHPVLGGLMISQARVR